MGRRGPKPTPTAKLKLRGSWHVSEREGEPEPDAALPEPPKWVSKDARKYWNPIAEQLHGLGIMAEVHSAALVLLVDALARYVRTRDEADKTGEWTTTDNGNAVTHPAAAARNKAWEQVLKALREFGMSPSALTGVRRMDDGKGDPKKGKARFFVDGA